ncbi:hypothetical protein [Phnomibacter sp. MR]|uniref:hypothetical protein n=1 Tax=Phnomibacter sp. MR TaxID=3042318 RepID=UPI003A80A130
MDNIKPTFTSPEGAIYLAKRNVDNLGLSAATCYQQLFRLFACSPDRPDSYRDVGGYRFHPAAHQQHCMNQQSFTKTSNQDVWPSAPACCMQTNHLLHQQYMLPKLYYVPGLISLLLLFPFFYHAAEPKLHSQTAVSFYLPRDSSKDHFSFLFSVQYIEQSLQKKQQTKFWLGEDAAYNKLSLQMIQEEALQLKLTHDTNRVVAAVLLPTATFNDVVSLINICLINEIKRYALARDTFYIFADPPPTNEAENEINLIGCFQLSEVSTHVSSSLYQDIIQYLQLYILPYWYWLCLYAILVVAAVVRMKRSYWPRPSKKNLTPN